MQEYSENFSAKLYKAEQVINHILQDAILLIGRDLSGKSTVLNWMSNQKMIGKKQMGRIIYSTEHQTKFMDHQNFIFNYALMPNKKTSIVEITSRIQRQYINAIGISYMLKALFQHIKTVRFVIVMQYNVVQSLEAQSWGKPFILFIKMFDQELWKSYKQKILLSSNLVVTGTRKTKPELIQIIKKTIQVFRNQRQSKSYKKQILQILEYLIEQDKIYMLSEAEIGKSPQQCNFSLNQPKNQISINVNELKISKFQFALEENLWNLSQVQKEKLNQFIKIKQQSYFQLSKIIKSFVERALFQDNWHKQTIDYSKQFDLVKRYLYKYDVYNKQKNNFQERLKQTGILLQFNSKSSNKKIYGIKILKGLKYIYQKIGQINYYRYYIKKQEQISGIKNSFKLIFQKLQEIFTKNKQQEIMIVDIAFVFMRNFREVQMLFEATQRQFNFLKLRIYELISDIYNQNLRELEFLFFKNQLAIFKNLQNIEEYIIEIKQFRNESNNQYQISPILMQYMAIVTDKIKGDKLFKEYQFKQALKLFYETSIKINKYLREMQRKLQSESSDQQDCQDQQQLNEKNQNQYILSMIQIQKIKIYDCMGETLIKLNKIQCAVEIFQNIQYIPKAIQCFEKMIKNSNVQVERFKYLMKLGDYCKVSYRQQNAIKAYQRAIQQTNDIKLKKQIEQNIREVLKNQQLYRNISNLLDQQKDKKDLTRKIQEILKQLYNN